MIKKILFFILLVELFSCDTREITQTGIEYAPLVGTYEGRCATFEENPDEVFDARSGSLRLFGIDDATVGVDASCVHLNDAEMKLSSANAERIVLSSGGPGISYSELIYFAKEDSILLIHFNQDTTVLNTLFSGVRN